MGMLRNPAGRLWYYSSLAYRRGWQPVALVLKTIVYVAFHTTLCFECELAGEVELETFGMGSFVHPNVTFGRGVKMSHHVSLAAETKPGSAPRMIVEDDVTIGAHVKILGAIRIGKGAVIAAGAIVTRDVAPGTLVAPLPARAATPVASKSETPA